jgi:hypothetical protein
MTRRNDTNFITVSIDCSRCPGWRRYRCGTTAASTSSPPINQLASGVGGDNGPAEGPVRWKEGGYLLFSDINGNRRMKYTPGQGMVEFNAWVMSHP